MSVGYIDRKCSGYVGHTKGSVLIMWGITTGSVLVYVGHTDRKCSHVCGAY